MRTRLFFNKSILFSSHKVFLYSRKMNKQYYEKRFEGLVGDEETIKYEIAKEQEDLE